MGVGEIHRKKRGITHKKCFSTFGLTLFELGEIHTKILGLIQN
jgi:hypothetical protein